MSAEKRRDARHAMRVRMDYRNRGGGDFLFEYSMNISKGGIFILTRDPLPVGTTVEMRFQPPGMEDVLEVNGRVVWVNEYRPESDDNPNPGMGIQFEGLAEEDKALIAEVVRAIAYLPE